MTDRELLELAARAAGIDIVWVPNYELGPWMASSLTNTVPTPWNPLRDPGDALRLAVALHLAIEVDGEEHEVRVFQTKYDSMNSLSAVEYIGNDPLAATMRAITRAAAEIGRAKT